jgi:excisionase family DNA binding protein
MSHSPISNQDAIVRRMSALVRQLIKSRSPNHTNELICSSIPVLKKRLLTPNEAASYYRVGRRVIVKLVCSGKLPAIRRQRCRGGKPGMLLRIEDCERELANISANRNGHV